MPKPHLSETARAGEARAAEVDMTNVTTTEMVTSRRQVTLRDAVAPQDPRDTPCRGGGGRRRHRRGGRKLPFVGRRSSGQVHAGAAGGGRGVRFNSQPALKSLGRLHMSRHVLAGAAVALGTHVFLRWRALCYAAQSCWC